MIPKEIAVFLEGAAVGFGATRNAELVPQIHLVQAWRVSDDRKAITCLFPRGYSEVLLPSLEENGKFSFTVLASTSGPRASHPPNPTVDLHECYQFKGAFLGYRPANERDLPLVNQKAEQFKAIFQPIFGFSERACDARYGKPALAMTFAVHEIYDQTPGPEAGTRITMDR
ncbi:MAG TPA: hypothetical protein VEK15_18125 [Vicinamibacteria bacterium]|nr:hypothetical protein [Vicinamibacteria bacterium]